MKNRGHIRIIGGRWRSRRLRVADAPGLRPTADAVRETVFNWLPSLHDKTCLDLFAGSGAFGFECASRGAKKVVLVESENKTVSALRDARKILCADAVEIVAASAEKFLQNCEDRFDVVFLDPPFASSGELLAQGFKNLTARGLLNPRALIYVESPRAAHAPPLPQNWRMIRGKCCGDARAALVQT